MNFIRRETFDMWDGVNNLFLYLSLGKNSKFKISTFGKIGKSYMKHLICRKTLSDNHFKIAQYQYKTKLQIIFKSWERR